MHILSERLVRPVAFAALPALLPLAGCSAHVPTGGSPGANQYPTEQSQALLQCHFDFPWQQVGTVPDAKRIAACPYGGYIYALHDDGSIWANFSGNGGDGYWR